MLRLTVSFAGGGRLVGSGEEALGIVCFYTMRPAVEPIHIRLQCPVGKEIHLSERSQSMAPLLQCVGFDVLKQAAQFLKELKERLESYRATDAAAAVQGISCFKCMKTLQEDLAGVGFARCVTPEGKDGYICQSCLKGF